MKRFGFVPRTVTHPGYITVSDVLEASSTMNDFKPHELKIRKQF